MALEDELKYEELWDRFSDDIDMTDIYTKQDLAEKLDEWLSPFVGKKNKENRQVAVEKLTERFWNDVLDYFQEQPRYIVMNVFQEEPEISPEIAKTAETAVERASRFATNTQRWASILGTLKPLYQKGIITLDKLRQIYEYIKL